MSNRGSPCRSYNKIALNPTRFEVSHMAAHEFVLPMLIRTYNYVAWRVREASAEEVATLPRITKTALPKMTAEDMELPAILMAGGRPIGVIEENK